MFNSSRLQLLTGRLELIASELDLIEAELGEVSAFFRLLEVPAPSNWPPPLNDRNSQEFVLNALRAAQPEDRGFTMWYAIKRAPRGLAGVIGIKGPPTDGEIEIGYSFLESEQGQGLASEGTRAIINWAFENPSVKCIVAHTIEELSASKRVLEKCGFAFTGPGPIEDGMETLRYELRRAP